MLPDAVARTLQPGRFSILPQLVVYRLIGLYASGFDDGNPSIGFGLNQRPEPFWRVTRGRGFLLCKVLSHLGVTQHRQNEVIEPVDDVGRCPRAARTSCKC